jgi:hypothetical protein
MTGMVQWWRSWIAHTHSRERLGIISLNLEDFKSTVIPQTPSNRSKSTTPEFVIATFKDLK